MHYSIFYSDMFDVNNNNIHTGEMMTIIGRGIAADPSLSLALLIRAYLPSSDMRLSMAGTRKPIVLPVPVRA
jgi:hypothetical protein